MTYYVGSENRLDDILGPNIPRFFYAIRRDEQGLVYFAKIDQLSGTGSITINNPGLAENNFEDFEYGVAFFNGRLATDHSRPYSNLQWDQYRWDTRNMFYYINDNGEFVARINQSYTYPPEAIV
jgi:hypothetical protein